MREREDAEEVEDFSHRESVELILHCSGRNGFMTGYI